MAEIKPVSYGSFECTNIVGRLLHKPASYYPMTPGQRTVLAAEPTSGSVIVQFYGTQNIAGIEMHTGIWGSVIDHFWRNEIERTHSSQDTFYSLQGNQLWTHNSEGLVTSAGWELPRPGLEFAHFYPEQPYDMSVHSAFRLPSRPPEYRWEGPGVFRLNAQRTDQPYQLEFRDAMKLVEIGTPQFQIYVPGMGLVYYTTGDGPQRNLFGHLYLHDFTAGE